MPGVIPHIQHSLAYHPVSVQIAIHTLTELLGYARQQHTSGYISRRFKGETTLSPAVNHILCLEDLMRRRMRVLGLNFYPQGSITEVTDGEVIYIPNFYLPRVILSNSSYLKNLVKLKPSLLLSQLHFLH